MGLCVYIYIYYIDHIYIYIHKCELLYRPREDKGCIYIYYIDHIIYIYIYINVNYCIGHEKIRVVYIYII